MHLYPIMTKQTLCRQCLTTIGYIYLWNSECTSIVFIDANIPNMQNLNYKKISHLELQISSNLIFISTFILINSFCIIIYNSHYFMITIFIRQYFIVTIFHESFFHCQYFHQALAHCQFYCMMDLAQPITEKNLP